MKAPLKLWYDICKRFSEQSKCQSRQVGCLIVQDGHLIAQGFNGAPSGSSCKECPRCNGGLKPTGTQLEQAICTHAESNAIGYCARKGIHTEGATMYCLITPCSECAKLIIAAGISEIICFGEYDSAINGGLLGNAGVKVTVHGIQY